MKLSTILALLVTFSLATCAHAQVRPSKYGSPAFQRKLDEQQDKVRGNVQPGADFGKTGASTPERTQALRDEVIATGAVARYVLKHRGFTPEEVTRVAEFVGSREPSKELSADIKAFKVMEIKEVTDWVKAEYAYTSATGQPRLVLPRRKITP